MSSTVFNDNELGDGLHYASLAGLLLLFVGCILFFVFYFGYHEAIDHETSTQKPNISGSAKTLEISWITVGGLGYLLCFSIIVGHFYKTKHDPRTVVGFNHVFHEMGDNLIKVETKLEDNDYLGTGGQSKVNMSGNFL
jgi:hypothetical protein